MQWRHCVYGVQGVLCTVRRYSLYRACCVRWCGGTVCVQGVLCTVELYKDMLVIRLIASTFLHSTALLKYDYSIS